MGHGAEDRGGGGASNPWLSPSIIPPLKKKTHTRGSEEGELSMPAAPAPRPAQRRPTPASPARLPGQRSGVRPAGAQTACPKGRPQHAPWGKLSVACEGGSHAPGGPTPICRPLSPVPCRAPPGTQPRAGPVPATRATPPPKCASVFPSGDGRKGLGDPSSSQSEAPAGQSWAALISLLSLVTHLSTGWWLGQPRTPTPTPRLPRCSPPRSGLVSPVPGVGGAA